MKKCKYYKPYMDTLKRIIKDYYGFNNCAAGGPLHILLDDDNYDMHSIHFCLDHCFEELIKHEHSDARLYYNKEECLIGIMICNEYAKMSLEERAIFDSYICGSDLGCCGDCDKCSNLNNDLHDFIKEKENKHVKNNGYGAE